MVYTFVFKNSRHEIMGRRQKRVTNVVALMDLVDEAAAWSKDGKQAFVYGPGIRTTLCCPYLLSQLGRGKLRIPLQ